ncbi:alpha-glucosidase [Chryseomicrobium aureum]|uniref:glycoside hydrolase family 13 protein n=1 Tax=Chryseomicrobium aureum TaxID=1441723 RepID=UPI00195EF851|nr:alpha-glucosidase [Chryseomicrobium aureum]MBM7706490.1 alpha-glucosidase [Chryseomicrobium aureum]
MKKTWWKEAVAYQVYPRSFQDSNGDGIGDLQGLISRLDYIQDLGIDIIWICPMYKSPNDDNGYDISDYQDIMDEFGTMEDFDLLLAEVHKRGMKLIIDLVINHSSDEHEWFIESRSSKESDKRDWYIWKDGKDGKEPNNWGSIFGGSAWEYDEASGQYFLHLFSTKQPDLNWENEDVRTALYDMVNWWLDKGIDGFRVDAISHIKKDLTFSDMPEEEGKEYIQAWSKYMNVEGIMPFLGELKEKTFANYDIMTVGEANGVSSEQISEWVNETDGKFDMVFQFEHLGLWDGNSLDVLELKNVLTRWQHALANDGWNALFIENHDKARIVSTWGNDQEYWAQSAKALATMYFFMKGTPFIYQGQEIGMTNVQFDSIDDYKDVSAKNMYRERLANGDTHEAIMQDLWQTSRDNSRTPMQWSEEMNAGFSEGTPWIGMNPNYTEINVDRQLSDEQSILNYYKAMIRLRKENDAFVYGDYDLVLAEDAQVYAYTRTHENTRFLVVANLTAEAASIESLYETVKDAQVVLANSDSESLELAPFEARIYKLV